MSIISSKSAKSKEGFIPYHQNSDLNERELSLFSRLNLNDRIQLQRPLANDISFDKKSLDLLSIGSKKRKLSQQLIKSSKIGNKTFLNRSLIGKSSLNGQLLNEIQSNYSNDHIKKQISQNSCPVVPTNNADNYDISYENQRIMEKKRFAKTKNLLRTISNYMHKFILYNKRSLKWIRSYFKKKLMKFHENLFIKGTQVQNSLAEEKDDEYDQECMEKNRNKQDNLQYQIEKEVKLFHEWIGELSITNFSDYEQVWSSPHKYKGLYRMICYKYIKNQAYCDIYRSRLTTKQISVQYLVQFIQGMLEPSKFYRFK